jgi:hypothetical protein
LILIIKQNILQWVCKQKRKYSYLPSSPHPTSVLHNCLESSFPWTGTHSVFIIGYITEDVIQV